MKNVKVKLWDKILLCVQRAVWRRYNADIRISVHRNIHNMTNRVTEHLVINEAIKEAIMCTNQFEDAWKLL